MRGILVNSLGYVLSNVFALFDHLLRNVLDVRNPFYLWLLDYVWVSRLRTEVSTSVAFGPITVPGFPVESPHGLEVLADISRSLPSDILPTVFLPLVKILLRQILLLSDEVIVPLH